jgi:hypothetical protein
MNNVDLISNYFTDLNKLFIEYFGSPYSQKLPFQKDTHNWMNYFYKSHVFRHVHLEYYKTDKLCVLHSNTFPDPLVDLPIMGFDLIAIGNKITGLFFDFTPTVTSSHALKHCLDNLHDRFTSEKRKLPEWATFFSDSFYCVTPRPEEIELLFKEIYRCIGFYLDISKEKTEQYMFNKYIQNAYCLGQQKNVKTSKALAVEIGADDANLFMTKYLFPVIDKK